MLFNIAFALFSLQAFVSALPQTATTAKDPKCLQPVEPGPCRMNLERYYYNSQTNACETFKFGGCRGNDNKFGFRQTCEEACVRSTSTTTSTTTTTTTRTTLMKPKENPTTPKVPISSPPTSRTLAKSTPAQQHTTSSSKPIKK